MTMSMVDDEEDERCVVVGGENGKGKGRSGGGGGWRGRRRGRGRGHGRSRDRGQGYGRGYIYGGAKGGMGCEGWGRSVCLIPHCARDLPLAQGEWILCG